MQTTKISTHVRDKHGDLVDPNGVFAMNRKRKEEKEESSKQQTLWHVGINYEKQILG